MSDRPEKTCVHCGEDCAGQPRTKDPKGRYYHNACYEERKRAIEARQSDDTPLEAPAVDLGLGPVIDAELDEDLDEVGDGSVDEVFGGGEPDGGLLAVPTIARTQQRCPECGDPIDPNAVLCTGCGYNLRTGGKLEVRESVGRPVGPGAGAQAIAMLLSPRAVGLIVLLFFGGWYLAGRSNEGSMTAYALVASGFSLVMSVIVIIRAFKTSVTTGLLTMCVPFFVLYFVFTDLESEYVKILFLESYLISIAVQVLAMQAGAF